MNDKELSEFVELLYPFFLKKLKKENDFKKCIKSANATVTWINTTQVETENGWETPSTINAEVKVKFPYDTTEITLLNKSVSELSVGDLVCVHYYIDLKNAYVAYKV